MAFVFRSKGTVANHQAVRAVDRLQYEFRCMHAAIEVHAVPFRGAL